MIEVIDFFKNAANKGIVGPRGVLSIKKLIGKYVAYRIFGYKDKYGKRICDYFKRAHK